MDIRGMHYDFKQKLNKVDSQQNRNFRVPEIDWKLNEALEIFIKSNVQPKNPINLSFEANQRSIDNIRPLVINNLALAITKITDTEYFATLPSDYLFYISADVLITKGTCGGRLARAIVKQHGDKHEESPFNISSFEWREVSIRFYEKGIRVFTDGTFIPVDLYLNYVRKPKYIHNAQDFLPVGSYNLPDGTALTGFQNCELAEHTHREIVDIAALIASGDLGLQSYQAKQAKINLIN